MDPALQQYIKDTPIYRTTVERFADMLPADDAALDALIAEIVKDCDARAFHFVIPAALSRGRPVDARHLVRGTMLFVHADWIMTLVGRFTGDVAGNLMTAIQQTQLSRENEAAVLFAIQLWCEKHPEAKLPEGFVAAARHLARRADWERHGTLYLHALAKRRKDDALLSLLKQSFTDDDPEWWARIDKSTTSLSETMSLYKDRDVLRVCTEKPSNILAEGRTFRRAVARVGRNEPCPCGSGKKYKHCCIEKDQARLHRSSSVAGITHEELRAQHEQHLTAALLDHTTTHQLARFDPLKIPLELRKPYVLRLAFFQLYDEAAVAFEKFGFPAELKETWENILYLATRAGRKESVRRLMAVYPDQSKVEEEIFSGTGLLLVDDDPEKSVKFIEEYSLSALQEEDPENARGFATALMFSRFRALGILVARGAIPRLSAESAGMLLGDMLAARDRLNLPPDEPFSDIVDDLLTESGDNTKEAAELNKSRKLLEIKAQEVRELKDTLERLQKEIVRREKADAVKTPAAAPTNIVPLHGDEAALKEMRRKMEELKSALKDRHNERNELRRQLQQTQSDLDALNKQAAPAAAEADSQADVEDNLLLPQESPEVQPVRLIDFPKNFSQRLAQYPRRVAQAAMVMIGRLAAGEPAAYVGALRLKALPNTMRQRIGSDYRLLFRLAPDRLEVIDLVNRKDLERRIKTLA